MKKNLLLTLFAATLGLSLIAQPEIEFDQTYGKSAGDNGKTIRQMADGSYIIAGTTKSYGSGDRDIYLIRADENGDTLWTKAIGGPGEDFIPWAMNNSLQLTDDGGYIITGVTNSTGIGKYDVYLVKTDSNGNVLWTTTFGGTSYDYGNCVQQTSDGGYIITGLTHSFGASGNDIYLVKTDGYGNMEWQNTYEFNKWENGLSVQQSYDGGYLVTGTSYGTGAFLFKTDTAGTFQWMTPLIDGSVHGHSTGFDIETTSDGGYIISGTTANDAFLAKTDAEGAIQWKNVYPGPGHNFGYAVDQTLDGGFIVAGETDGEGAGLWDFYVFKTDSSGDTLWTTTYGGTGNDWAHSVQETMDGGYAMVGFTNSFGAGASDVWFLKLSPQSVLISGKVYEDGDEDCVYNSSSDIALANRIVKAEPGPYYAFTDDNGNFEFLLDPGSYEISLDTLQDNLFSYQSCQIPSYTVNATPGSNTVGIDFATKANALVASGTVNIVSAPFEQGNCGSSSLTSPCPGFVHRYTATINNSGNSTIGAGSELQIALDPNLAFKREVSNPCGLAFDSTSLTWTIPSSGVLTSGKSCEVSFDVYVNGISAPYLTTATFHAKSGSQTVSSTDYAIDADECSCDPNDLAVVPKGCGPYGTIGRGEGLTYRIRFQNTGSGPAYKVVLQDTLDRDLNLKTLNVLHSSHAVTRVQVEPHNVLSVYFEGIELPAEITDPEGSKGDLFFSIDPDADLRDGTEITNQAAIYFDRNLPVITNSTLNTIRDNPYPIVSFDYQRQCNAIDNVYDFNYTGGTSDGADFHWDFGADATPSVSSDEHPAGVTFNSPGQKEVTLTVTRYGCSESASATVAVEDVSCGNNKVLICHNSREICVSRNAAESHIAHGDCIGPCPSATNKKGGDDFAEESQNHDKLSSGKQGNVFSAYPNPFKETTTVSFTSAKSEHVKIVVYSYTGQVIKMLFDAEAEASRKYQFELDAADLAPGFYFGKMLTGGHAEVFILSKQ